MSVEIYDIKQSYNRSSSSSRSIQPTHFSLLNLEGINFNAIIEHYFDWIEGVGFYDKKQMSRKSQGVPSPLNRNSLLQGNTINGDFGCQVSMRINDDEILIHFIHRDSINAEIHWYSVIRLRQINGNDNRITLEHATGRTLPPFLNREPVAGAPIVLSKLLELPGVKSNSQDLIHRGPINIHAGQASDFVKYILLDKERTLPYLIISELKDTKQYLVKPNDISKILSTQVVVATIDYDATREFQNAFSSLGYDQKLGACFDGAARVYQNDIINNRNPFDHYLWLPERINNFNNMPSEKLAGEVSERVLWRVLPPRFFMLLDDWNRKENHEKIDAYLINELKYKEETQSLSVQLDLKKRENEDLRTQLQISQKDANFWEEEATNMDKSIKDHKEKLETAEQERDEARQKLVVYSTKNEATKSNVTPLYQPCKIAIQSALKSRALNLHDALLIIDTIFDDRVVILPTAWKSAKESASFKKIDKAWGLILRLVNEYWEEIQKTGDAGARKIFPEENYAARESQSVERNSTAKENRTFIYNGEKIVMWKHLKIGVKDNLVDTWRLHFHYYSKNKRIIIGHCGKHLDVQ